MPDQASIRSLHGQLAANRRHGHTEAAERAHRDFAAAKLQAYIEKTVATAPPLSPEQRDRLTLLLRAPSGGTAE